ncbi:HAMP domain-containing sensor histidine kinase [Rhodococcus aerolatus]
MGLRLRLTLLTGVVAAAVSTVLLALGWVLAGRLTTVAPGTDAGTGVVVDGVLTSVAVLTDTVREQAQADVLRRGVVAVVLVVAAAVLLAWVLTGRALRPLRRVTATARRLSQEHLDERIDLDGPHDEVRDLADTVDAMLDRLQAAFAVQQRFVADASHELRTPLAIMRTEVDVTLADPHADVAELRRMGEVLRSATDRAEAMVDGLLVVARTAATGLAQRERVDVAGLVGPALAAVAGEARERGLDVRTRLHPLVVDGDPALLERVVGNLVENAVRHNVPGGWVDVACGTELVVSSSGAELDPAAVPELFEPFRRGGPARTAHRGSGLGLAVVAAVVTAHGGRVSARAVPGGGLAVTVSLPAAAG